MPILIDGHNLIGQLSSISLKDPDDEEKLVRMLLSYQARTGKAITVVFDPGTPTSRPQRHHLGKVEAIFVRGSGDADTTIVRRIRASDNPVEWQVVTSDHDLAENVKHLGARVLSAHHFAAELEADGEAVPEHQEPSLSPEEVNDWLALFGERD